MKKIILKLIFMGVMLIFITSCYDNSISDPDNNIIDKPYYNSHKEVINICCPLNDPLSGVCNISGFVTYYHEILSYPPDKNGLFKIYVILEMNSEICDMLGGVHLAWSVSAHNEDIIFVSEEGIAILQKEYGICNRPDIVLVVDYLISTEGVGIAKISVKQLTTAAEISAK